MTALAEMTSTKTGEQERRCIVSGETAPKHGLLRFVVGPENVIVPDLGERLPGRGIWVSADRDALQKAGDKKLFTRAAKMQVTVPEDLVKRVEMLLVKRCMDVIGRSEGARTDLYLDTTVSLKPSSGAVRVSC